MANTTISPNMGLPVPVPGQDPGPDWANNIVADMSVIDSHNHSNGQGVQVSPGGLNINADLPIGGNNLTLVRTTRFTPQLSLLSAAADIGCLYEVGVDLYYNDGGGNQIRITQSGAVTGATGTITGLPSGTASASFGGGAFTFQSATSTPATMNVGPLVIGASVASSKTVTISPSNTLPANYAWTLPQALPSSPLVFMTMDDSGNLFTRTQIPLVGQGTPGGVQEAGQLGATNTSDDAVMGYVGEYIENIITTLQNVSASGTIADFAQVTLSGGDWDVSGTVTLINPGGTSFTTQMIFLIAISGTTGNSSAGIQLGFNAIDHYVPAASFPNRDTLVIPRIRVKSDGVNLIIKGVTTVGQVVYLKGEVDNYISNTPQYLASISARRVR